MIIKSKLTKKDFVNVNFVIMYGRPVMKVYTGLGLLAILLSILFFLSGANYSSSLQTLLSGIGILAFFPAFIYITASRSFSNQNRLSETIEYQFEEDNLIIKGESFSSQMSWDKIYKVTLKKNWLLIWSNKQIATPILRTDVWEGEINDLKKILDKHQVKNNL